MALVLVDILVKPKNSVIRNRKSKTLIHNITKNCVYDNNYSFEELPEWIEEIDRKWVLFHDDVLLLDIIADASDPEPPYYISLKNELVNEGYLNEIGELPILWNEVMKPKFGEQLSLRKEDEFRKRCLMEFVITGSEDYFGEFSCTVHISKIVDCLDNFKTTEINRM